MGIGIGIGIQTKFIAGNGGGAFDVYGTMVPSALSAILSLGETLVGLGFGDSTPFDKLSHFGSGEWMTLCGVSSELSSICLSVDCLALCQYFLFST